MMALPFFLVVALAFAIGPVFADSSKPTGTGTTAGGTTVVPGYIPGGAVLSGRSAKPTTSKVNRAPNISAKEKGSEDSTTER
jgi:hypothetical protein